MSKANYQASLGLAIEPYPKDHELEKRFPLPDMQVTCPNCEKRVALEGITTDYPPIGKPVNVHGYCPNCTHEITIRVVIHLIVVAAR